VGKNYSFEARLKIGGAAKSINSFEFEAPTGVLGSRLSATLADPLATVDTSQTIKFEVAVEKGGNKQWITLMDVSRITDVDFKLTPSGDLVSINAISPMNELWQLSPRRPIVLYDPEQVDIVTLTSESRSDVFDEDGNPIESEYVSIAQLDLYQLLDFVYKTKLGFIDVTTNIPNYPVKRSEISISSSYHSVAAAQVSLFQPFDVETNSNSGLFICDPWAKLPTGLKAGVRKIPISAAVTISRKQSAGALINAVLLSYRQNTRSDAFTGAATDRVDQEIQEVGTFGQEGWQRTVINRFVKEFHDDPRNQARVTREIIWKVESRTSAKAGGIVREVAIETQTDIYDYDWRLKRGYTKIIQLYSKLPGQSAQMREAQREVNTIIWTSSLSNPTNLLKTWELTETTGTILVSVESDEDVEPTKTSLYEANRTNSVPESTDDATVQLGKPISTIIERWREVGPDQIEVAYQKIDQLAGRPEQTKTVQHTGTIEARLGNDTNQTQTRMLLRNEESETAVGPRVPLSLDAGDVPFDIAETIAQRILDRQGQQPQRVYVEFAGFDAALRRGSLRRVEDREGNKYLAFITGYSIAMQAPEFKAVMKANGIVLEVN
jgi:hypothetical protein